MENVIQNKLFKIDTQFPIWDYVFTVAPIVVIGSKEEAFRLPLVQSFRQVLRNALRLLGIETLEEM